MGKGNNLSKFIKSLALFAVSAPIVHNKAEAMANVTANSYENLEPVSIRPLNYEYENMFAAHRSHSSHSSHSSHYSGSGYSGYSSSRTPTYSVPTYTAPSTASSYSGTTSATKKSSNITVKTYNNIPTQTDTTPNPFYSNSASVNTGANDDPVLARVLQVKRVQMSLLRLGYYSGKIDGDLGKNTRKAIANYQVDKALTVNGRMTTELLNSLGIPAVNFSE